MITYVKGDVTAATNGIIAHICNNVGAYNVGVAKCIRDKFPIAYQRYKNLAQYQMGVVHFVKVADNLFVANMIAQKGLPSKERPKPLKYGYLEKCLYQLLQCDKKYDFHMPRIGTGFGGGDWSIIEPMISAILVNRNVYVWEL